MSRFAKQLAASASLAAIALAAPAYAQSSASDFTSATRYDKAGRVTGTIAPDPDGSGSLKYAAVRNTYDINGRLTKVERGELATWQSEAVEPVNWGSAFSLITQVDTVYDGLDRKIRESVSDGTAVSTVTQFNYDEIGRPKCTAVRMNTAAFSSLPSDACALGTEGAEGPDRITRNVYKDDGATLGDHLGDGQLLKVQKAYGTSIQLDYVSYTYTDNGKQATVTDAGGNKAAYEYDGFDRLTKWSFPSKTTPGTVSTTDFEAYEYDLNNNRTKLTKRDGAVLDYQYDALNRNTHKKVPNPGSGPAATTTTNCHSSTALSVASDTNDVCYDYNARGLQTAARFGWESGPGVSNDYDGFGRAVVSTTSMDGTARALASQYDADGNRTRITHPDNHYVDYLYDGLDRQRYGYVDGVDKSFAIVFVADGHRGYTDMVNGYTSYGYDGVGRKTYDYTSFNVAPTGTVQVGFQYNAASQIVQRSRTNDAYAFTGYVSVSRAYTSNGLNQYSQAGAATFGYDGNGNLTSDGTLTYNYDAENRLLSTSGGAALKYDPLGRLYETSDGTTVKRFLYDGDALLAEYNNSGTILRRYVHGPGLDEPMVVYEGSGMSASARRFLYRDQQGSVVVAANNAGAIAWTNTYDEYGIPGSGNAGRFQYTGQAWISEIGMYYYKARIYSPTLGRFLQTDPIGYEDQVNLYAYVANDPVNGRDPTGKSCTGTGSGRACVIDHIRTNEDGKVVVRKLNETETKHYGELAAGLTDAVNSLASTGDAPQNISVTMDPETTVSINFTGEEAAANLSQLDAVIDTTIDRTPGNGAMSNDGSTLLVPGKVAETPGMYREGFKGMFRHEGPHYTKSETDALRKAGVTRGDAYNRAHQKAFDQWAK